MADLYSIVGVFDEVFRLVPFGGYFVRGLKGCSQNQIVGQIVDRYGQSKIEGQLDEENGLLEFRKQYMGCNSEQVFDYKFSLEKGIWQGRFSSPSRDWSGRSSCKIDLFRKLIEKSPGECSEIELVAGAIMAGLVEVVEGSETEQED